MNDQPGNTSPADLEAIKRIRNDLLPLLRTAVWERSSTEESPLLESVRDMLERYPAESVALVIAQEAGLIISVMADKLEIDAVDFLDNVELRHFTIPASDLIAHRQIVSNESAEG